MVRCALVLMMGFCLLVPSRASADDPCAVLLSDGVYETFASNNLALTQGSFHSAMCNSTIISSSSQGSRDAGLDIGIGKVNLGLSTQEAQQFQQLYRQVFCGSVQANQLAVSQVSQFQSVASASIISGYNECVKLRTKGLEADVSVTPDRRVISFSFRFISQNNAPAPKFKKVSITPDPTAATCELINLTPEGLIDSTNHEVICSRQRSDALLVSVITEYGSIQKYLPDEGERELTALAGRISTLENEVSSLRARLNGIRLVASDVQNGAEWACGQGESAGGNLQFMVGSRDGTGCGVKNQNYYRTLSLSVPSQ